MLPFAFSVKKEVEKIIFHFHKYNMNGVRNVVQEPTRIKAILVQQLLL